MECSFMDMTWQVAIVTYQKKIQIQANQYSSMDRRRVYEALLLAEELLVVYRTWFEEKCFFFLLLGFWFLQVSHNPKELPHTHVHPENSKWTHGY